MKTRPKTPESVGNLFAKDTAKHVIRSAKIDGLHRHIEFRNPKCSVAWFAITTWPGMLCISGDMGTYVFQRLADMFRFFRGPGINPGYWAEKIEAGDKEEFSIRKFREHLVDSFRSWCRDEEIKHSERRNAWFALRDALLDRDFDNEYCAREALRDAEDEFPWIRDTFEWDFQEYTFHYLWCCHAIVWGIAQVDAMEAAKAAAAHSCDGCAP